MRRIGALKHRLIAGLSGILCLGYADGEGRGIAWHDGKLPVIPDALFDRLLPGADATTPFDKDGLLDELKKALAERTLNAEMGHHLEAGEGDGNQRNGYGRRWC